MNRSIGDQKLRQLVCAGAIAAGFIAPLVQTTPADANCDAPRRIFTFSQVRTIGLLTNIRSEWADQGFTITHTVTRTATVQASVSGQIGVEADFIVVKASGQLGVSVGVSWSKAGTWSYAAKVPPGKEGRIVMYHDGRHLAVTKRSLGAHCAYVVRYRNVPIKVPLLHGDGNVFRMQLRSRAPRALRRRDDDYFEQEIDLPNQPNQNQGEARKTG
jgi:hypothetical protein